jgi:fucose permease
MKHKSGMLLVGIAYSGFVVLGLPGGLLGVAWPSMRASFGLSLDAVGALLVAMTTGYLVSSFSSGPLLSRVGVGTLLMVSSVVAGGGLLGYALAPAWWVMILLGLVAGMGAGVIDAGLNTYFATNHRASLMNWLHACFGLGAALGPAMMTAVLDAGRSWRWGYVVVGVLQGLLALCFGLTVDRWRLAGTGPPGANPGSTASTTGKMRSGDTLRLPILWLGIGLFFVYAGIENTAGQWPYTLFTEGRGVSPGTAGLWVSVYWGSLTVGRVVLGFVVDRLGVVSALRVCMLSVVLGSALVWWNATDVVGFLGLALVGFSLAPVFPSLTSDTPQRIGAAHAANAIGFQVAAAGIGIATLPGLAGVLAERVGLEIIGPFLVGASVAMFLLHEVVVWRRAKPEAEAVGLKEQGPAGHS